MTWSLTRGGGAGDLRQAAGAGAGQDAAGRRVRRRGCGRDPRGDALRPARHLGRRAGARFRAAAACWSTPPTTPALGSTRACPPRSRSSRRPRETSAIGCARSSRREFEDGAMRVVLIGSDAPTLDPSIVISAFLCLEGRDVVLGPVDRRRLLPRRLPRRRPADLRWDRLEHARTSWPRRSITSATPGCRWRCYPPGTTSTRPTTGGCSPGTPRRAAPRGDGPESSPDRTSDRMLRVMVPQRRSPPRLRGLEFPMDPFSRRDGFFLGRA